jgi:hypothetical protein
MIKSFSKPDKTLAKNLTQIFIRRIIAILSIYKLIINPKIPKHEIEIITYKAIYASFIRFHFFIADNSF